MTKTKKSKMFKLLAMIMAAVMLMSAMMVQAFAEEVTLDAEATVEEEINLLRASVMDTESGEFDNATVRAIIAYFSDTNDFIGTLSYTKQATRMVMTIYGEYYDGTHPGRRMVATNSYDRYTVQSVTGSVNNSTLPAEYTDAICGYTRCFLVVGEVTSMTYIPQVDL